MDLTHLAKYPFLPEASLYMREQGITLNDLIDSRAYGRARSKGIERVEQALEEGELKGLSGHTEADLIIEVLSYPVARIIVSCTPDIYLIRRYATSEAKLLNKRLREEDDVFISSVATSLGLLHERDGGRFGAHFADYLKYTKRLKSREYHLVHQDLRAGKVWLTRERFIRVMEQLFQERLESELPLEINDSIYKRFKDTAERLHARVEERKSQYKPEEMGKVSITRIPPCMKSLLAKAQAGENLPHSARFSLTAFLHAIGMDSEEIIKVFSLAPDFKEKIARYQVEHITGKTSGTEYTPPVCDTMRTYNLCVNMDELCKRDWMTHPLTYYRVKGRRRGAGGKGRRGPSKEGGK